MGSGYTIFGILEMNLAILGLGGFKSRAGFLAAGFEVFRLRRSRKDNHQNNGQEKACKEYLLPCLVFGFKF